MRASAQASPRRSRAGALLALLLIVSALAAPAAGQAGASAGGSAGSGGNGFLSAIGGFLRSLGLPSAASGASRSSSTASGSGTPALPATTAARPRGGRLRGINFPPPNVIAGANAVGSNATAPPADAPPAAAAAAAVPAADTAKPTNGSSRSSSSNTTAAGAALLHIAHVNDVHNRIEETSPTSATCTPENKAKGVCLGGWARIATAVAGARRRAAEAGAGFLFLDVGDQFDGTLWDIRYKGQATAAIQRVVRPDAMTLGNHEFAFPPDVLRAYIDRMGAPMLGACNVDVSKVPELRGRVRRWRVFDVSGRKVAALGWLTPDTGFLMPNAANVTFAPVEESVRRCITDLKREHPEVGLIIGLSHTGYHRDLETAAAVPELDIILGGHSHTFLNAGDRPGPIYDTTAGATPDNCVAKGACDQPLGLFPTLVKTQLCGPAPAAAAAPAAGPRCAPKVVPVVQAYYASKYVGNLVIDLDTRNLVASSPVLLGGPNSTNPVEPDAAITKLIKAMSGPVQELEARIAGRVDTRAVGGAPGRLGETNFGDLMADVVVRASKRLSGIEKRFGPVDIGILTGGGIRSDIGPGNVTYGSVMAAMPFGNTLAIKSLSGDQIRAGLTHGLSGMADNAGRFPQISGLRMWHRGDKLLDAARLLPGGKTAPLGAKTRHNVASTSYILNGGDGYSVFAGEPRPIYPSGDPVDELLISALVGARPDALPVPDPAKERRIIDCAKPYVDCGNAALYGPCCRG